MNRVYALALAFFAFLSIASCGDEWRWCGIGSGPDNKWCFMCPGEDAFDACCSFYPNCDACVETTCNSEP